MKLSPLCHHCDNCMIALSSLSNSTKIDLHIIVSQSKLPLLSTNVRSAIKRAELGHRLPVRLILIYNIAISMCTVSTGKWVIYRFLSSSGLGIAEELRFLEVSDGRN